MVRMKGRSLLKQHMPNKPTKFGAKLFVACDVKTSCMPDIDVYTGAIPNQGEVGLTQAVVERITQEYHGQGYVVFTDNFYTSQSLANSLLQDNTRLNQTGVPQALKNTAHFERHAE